MEAEMGYKNKEAMQATEREISLLFEHGRTE